MQQLRQTLQDSGIKVCKSKNPTDAEWAYRYAKDFLKGRFKIGETSIVKSTLYSYLYTKNVMMSNSKWKKCI